MPMERAFTSYSSAVLTRSESRLESGLLMETISYTKSNMQDDGTYGHCRRRDRCYNDLQFLFSLPTVHFLTNIPFRAGMGTKFSLSVRKSMANWFTMMSTHAGFFHIFLAFPR